MSTDSSTHPITGTTASESAVQAAKALRIVFGRLRRRMLEVASSDDITPSQASVLARLAKGEAATAAGLATIEGVRPQSIAATIAGLEQQGLVHRTPDPGDGRRQLIELTEAGRQADEGNRVARREWVAEAIEHGLTEAERATVIAAMQLLERVVAE